MRDDRPEFELELIGEFTDQHLAVLAELLVKLDEAEQRERAEQEPPARRESKSGHRRKSNV